MNILVLVHPGSACGSADFNLGPAQAREARDALISEIQCWQGGILVIDSEFSNELPRYPGLHRAITQMLEVAKMSGQIRQRLVGDDPEQVERITEFVAAMSEKDKARASFTVTGAWYDPCDREGCVNSVHKRLLALGYKSQVSESAVEVATEDEDGPAERLLVRP